MYNKVNTADTHTHTHTHSHTLTQTHSHPLSFAHVGTVSTEAAQPSHEHYATLPPDAVLLLRHGACVTVKPSLSPSNMIAVAL
jgi:hypothetical protein